MREKILLCILTVMLLTVEGGVALGAAANAQFVDLSSTNYEDAIRYVASQGIVEGYLLSIVPPGMSVKPRVFKPLNKINRAEFTKIIVASRFDDTTIKACIKSSFPDVRNTEWYAAYVCVAKEQAIIGGYPDNTFRPGNDITFVEAAKIIVEAFGFSNNLTTEQNGPWYSRYLEILEAKHAIPPSITSFGHVIQRDEVAEILYRLLAEKDKLPSITQKQIKSLSETKKAQILDYPFADNLFCLAAGKRDLPVCADFYEVPCPDCEKTLSCGEVVNPVCGRDGKSYPNACFARLNKVAVQKNGVCPATYRFISDLWLTKKYSFDNLLVPSPHVTFVFSNDRSYPIKLDADYADSYKSGFWLQSMLYDGVKKYRELNFNIAATHYGETLDNKVTTRGFQYNPLEPSGSARMLIIYVRFADFFDEQDLTRWTAIYADSLNNYLAKVLKIPNPLQLQVTPVVISPPQGITYQDFAAQYRAADEAMRDDVAVYDAALKKIGKTRDDFDHLVFALISSESQAGINGYASGWYNAFYDNHNFNMAIIRAKISKTPLLYGAFGFKDEEPTAKVEKIENLAAFQEFFTTLSHELLHNLGWNGEHVPNSTDETRTDVDFKTGEKIVTTFVVDDVCEFTKFDHHYYIKLPADLAIKVGERPNWLTVHKDGCAQFGKLFFQDHDGDGWYDLLTMFEPITQNMRAAFGWTDIDDDDIIETEDTSPYGGFVNFSWGAPIPDALFKLSVPVIVGDQNEHVGGPAEGYYPELPNIVGSKEPERSMLFTTLGPEEHEGCVFEKIRLEDGFEGLLPLECKEFNDSVVNVYRGVRYYWYFVKKAYGVVLLPRTI